MPILADKSASADVYVQVASLTEDKAHAAALAGVDLSRAPRVADGERYTPTPRAPRVSDGERHVPTPREPRVSDGERYAPSSHAPPNSHAV